MIVVYVTVRDGSIEADICSTEHDALVDIKNRISGWYQDLDLSGIDLACDLEEHLLDQDIPVEFLIQPFETPSAAIEQLEQHQEQLDADGIRVGVSRQALDEVLGWFR